ncbi:hypothetical protein B0H17DRAFT_1204235 [Mycena rosella]|uniref:Uncharacterized protein n=1 Tax=Mycena rosella TaxID=1033263 RepID=A0AAD7D9Z4_MYCRO|nr:hypothetical protein B0H17DRAFT_1204235 [Mycena rosella]
MSLLDTLPEASVLELASKNEVWDVAGAKVAFGSVFAQQKTVVVFIRHFFCGICQLYVEQLAAVPEAALESAGTKIVIVGCGEWKAIQNYVGQAKRSYITMGSWSNAWQSLKTGPFKDPSLIGKQGNFTQLGGDFVLGPGNQCNFAHRMQHTEDHVEVADLMKTAAVTLP